MSAIALVSDLMAGSQLSAAAGRAGVELVVVSSQDALAAEIEKSQPRLVVVDLGHPGLDPQALLARVKPLLPSECTCLAFGPHVHKQRLAAAAEAGFDPVLSRGGFHAEAEALLKRFAGGAS